MQNRSTDRRVVVGALRIAAGAAVLVAIVTQIVSRVAGGVFDPAEYFSFFTIQSGLINIVILAVGGVMALRLPHDTVVYTTVRASVVAYAVVTGIVYNLLLRGAPERELVGPQWPTEILHVVAPIVIVLDWLLSPGRPALPWSALRVALVYPVAWLAYTLLRGVATGLYPYPFIDPATNGWGSVIAYIAGLTAFIFALVALVIAYGRRFGRPAGAAAPSTRRLPRVMQRSRGEAL